VPDVGVRAFWGVCGGSQSPLSGFFFLFIPGLLGRMWGFSVTVISFYMYMYALYYIHVMDVTTCKGTFFSFFLVRSLFFIFMSWM
jgi:hypothetical protein